MCFVGRGRFSSLLASLESGDESQQMDAVLELSDFLCMATVSFALPHFVLCAWLFFPLGFFFLNKLYCRKSRWVDFKLTNSSLLLQICCIWSTTMRSCVSFAFLHFTNAQPIPSLVPPKKLLQLIAP